MSHASEKPTPHASQFKTNRIQVALLIETSSKYGRAILSGVGNYMKTESRWSVFLEEKDIHQETPQWLYRWNGHGILSRNTTPDLADYCQKKEIPLVELTDRGVDYGFHAFRSNDKLIGDMAAEHLLERGLRNFAYVGFSGEAWSLRRLAGFQDRLAQNKFEVNVFESPWAPLQNQSFDNSLEQISSWLKELPKPIGVMACNDVRGQHVLSACRSLEIFVPEEVSIIGVDNDELHCSLSSPPLSSVIPDSETIGFEAAKKLASLLNGESTSERLQQVDPIGIATRQSTETIAVDDPDIAAAIAFMRENACRGISVDDVIDAISISRSSLERGMRRYLSRSPRQEIRRNQLKRACRFLTETDLALDKIAEQCGYKHPEYMHVVFKRETGITPGEYRKKRKPG